MTARALDRHRAALVVVDIQEGFRKVLPDFAGVARAIATLVSGARELGVPIVVTEQYPRGLGDTAPEVVEALGETPRLEKIAFSACRADGFDLDGRDQAVVCGIETHICVNQTVLDLLDSARDVHVVADAVGSRTPENRELGLHKIEHAGAVVTSVETALFELLSTASAPEFKAIQGLIK